MLSSALINDALEAWRLEEHSYQNEIARTTFLKAQVARGMGHDEEAEELTAQAVQIRAQLLGSKTTTGPLTEADFDEVRILVCVGILRSSRSDKPVY